jgi:hypothetical protein
MLKNCTITSQSTKNYDTHALLRNTRLSSTEGNFSAVLDLCIVTSDFLNCTPINFLESYENFYNG